MWRGAVGRWPGAAREEAAAAADDDDGGVAGARRTATHLQPPGLASITNGVVRQIGHAQLNGCDVGWLVLLSLLIGSAAAVDAITPPRRGLSWCEDGERGGAMSDEAKQNHSHITVLQLLVMNARSY